MVQPLTFPELFALPTIVDLSTAARAVGVSKNTAYRWIAVGCFPCPVLRPGWRYQVPTAGLLQALQITGPHVWPEHVHRDARSNTELL